MRILATALCVFLVGGVAFAGSPPDENVIVHQRTDCGLQYVAIDWNFAQGNQSFTTAICQTGAVAAAWAWGTCTIPGAPGTVWGTVLNGSYNNNSGESLIAPAFTVSPSCYLMEVYHYYDIETNFDGCNVTANGTVVAPVGGYDGTISTSTSYLAYCVDMEPGFTGHVSTWGWDCWDLSSYMGQSVVVTFDFGSDSSVQYPGWYIAQIRIGGENPTPAGSPTWGAIKNQFN